MIPDDEYEQSREGTDWQLAEAAGISTAYLTQVGSAKKKGDPVSHNKTAISEATAKHRPTGWGRGYSRASPWVTATVWTVPASCVGFTWQALEYRWILDLGYYVVANLQLAIAVCLLGRIFYITYDRIWPRASLLLSWVVVWLVCGVIGLVTSIVLAFCLPLVSAIMTGGDLFHSGAGVMLITARTLLVSVVVTLLLSTILTIRDAKKTVQASGLGA